MRAFDRGSIRVLIPVNYVVTPPRGMSSERKGRNTLFTRGEQATPQGIYECFAASDREAFRTESITLPDGRAISVEAWSDDKEWADEVRRSLEEDVPALLRTLGHLEAPEIARITETIPRSACAIPGGCPVAVIDPSTGTVSLGQYAATDGGVTDSLASLWFGKDVFRDPWLTAGHAEWAQIASGTTQSCNEPSNGDKSNVLAEWRPAPLEVIDPDPEQAAYVRGAACAVVLSVAKAAGTDRYVEAMAALRAGIDPFGVSPAAPRGAVGWKEWLDAVEVLALLPGGADSTAASQLLAKYDTTLEAELEERASALSEYRDLTVVLDGAGPPAVVEPLRDWEFETAREAISLSLDAWSAADAAGDAIPELIGRTTPVQEALLAAANMHDLEEALDLGELQFELATDAAEVLREGSSPDDVLEQLGMVGASRPSQEGLIDAVAAVDRAHTVELINERRSASAEARTAGLQRLIVAAVLLMLVTIAVLVFVRRRSRSGLRAESPSNE
jgi:hypothetical protein